MKSFVKRAICGSVLGVICASLWSAGVMAAPSSAPLALSTLSSTWLTDQNLTEYMAWIQSHQAEFPIETATEVIGYSVQQRPIWQVALGNPQAEKNVLLVCGQHGDEPDSMQTCLYLLRDILSQNSAIESPALTANNPWHQLLSQTRLHIVPMLNPDGRALQTRKNARGVNLNANWSWGWKTKIADAEGFQRHATSSGASYRGVMPFSEPETRALKQWIEKHQPAKVIDYHTGVASFSQGNIFYPFTHASENTLTQAEEDLLYSMALAQAQALSRVRTEQDPVLPMQTHEVVSYLNYAIRHKLPAKYHEQALSQLPKNTQSTGSMIDWVFGTQKIPALGFEIYAPEPVSFQTPIAQFNAQYETLQPGLHRALVNLLQK